MKVSLGWAFVVAFAVTYFSAFFGVQWALGAPALVPGDPRTGQVSKVYAPHASSGSDPDGLPDAVAPGRAAAPPAAAPAPVAPAAPAPAAPRAVALFVSSCPRLTDAAVRRVVAVELGARLIATGAAAPADVDRVLIGCNGQVARIEAGDPATPRYAERTLPLDQFRGDAAARAVGL
ncbi:MAG TPA: hypothetical protein VKQ32_24630, partial [Polyangia bacterium]|nr:hypothetical protein [Polyangia bacterium]